MVIKNGDGTTWQRVVSFIIGGAAILGVVGPIIYSIISIGVQQSIQGERNTDVIRRLDALRSDMETTKLDIARQKAALVEIETQFCASDAARNLTHANDLRMMALLWEKSFAQPYNIGAIYYPQICNRDRISR